MTGSVAFARVTTHHLQHGSTTGPHEAGDESSADEHEDDVQHGGVVEANRDLTDLGVTRARNEAQGTEEELDDIAGADHGDVEAPEYEEHHRCPVVLPVDEQNRHDDEVGEDESHHTTEADPAVPKHRRQ